MSKRRKKTINEKSDSAMSQTDGDNHENDHTKKAGTIESTDINASKQSLLRKISIFKMIHENKREDGKALTSETRIKTLNEIQTLSDEMGHKTSLEDYMIGSIKVRRLTYRRQGILETMGEKKEFCEQSW